VGEPWRSDPGETGLRQALRTIAPELADRPMRLNPRHTQANPLYHSASAWIDDTHVVKYAWSDVRGQRLRRERALLERLRAAGVGLPVPEVVAASDDPTLFVTRAVPGEPLSWELAGRLGAAQRVAVADELASFLTGLHSLPLDEVLAGLPTVVPTAQSDTTRLRRDFPAIVDEGRAATVLRWCDWVDEVFSVPGSSRPVLVHGDLHGYNQVWDGATPTPTLQAVVDLEECGAADPHFDFRYLPGNAPTVELLLDVARSYERASGREVDLRRVMAWHVLTVLGDALWRTEAGVDLPGGGDAASWVDDLGDRLEALDLR
jgi:aminoglycoside phosphotransferase (APT) family kinase protein